MLIMPENAMPRHDRYHASSPTIIRYNQAVHFIATKGYTMTTYHLAQINIAQMQVPLDDPQMKDFVDNIDRINAVADDADGFVWRLQTEEGDATALRIFNNEYLIVNMSVWASIDALFAYTYKSDHVDIYRRRREWFDKMQSHYMALWWIPAGHIPTTEEARDKLAYMDEYGITPLAFTFKQRYTPEEMLAYGAR
jgi:hypothetical protein